MFSPLLHTSEGKAEGNERQSKLRASMDLFIRNLRVSCGWKQRVEAISIVGGACRLVCCDTEGRGVY